MNTPEGEKPDPQAQLELLQRENEALKQDTQRAIAWALSMVSAHHAIVRAVHDVARSATLGPPAKAQRVICYKDRFDDLYEVASRPIPDPEAKHERR